MLLPISTQWHSFLNQILSVLFFAVVVFNLSKAGNISKALSGEKIGTLIDGSGVGNQMI